MSKLDTHRIEPGQSNQSLEETAIQPQDRDPKPHSLPGDREQSPGSFSWSGPVTEEFRLGETEPLEQSPAGFASRKGTFPRDQLGEMSPTETQFPSPVDRSA